jgi:hypothetical protein
MPPAPADVPPPPRDLPSAAFYARCQPGSTPVLPHPDRSRRTGSAAPGAGSRMTGGSTPRRTHRAPTSPSSFGLGMRSPEPRLQGSFVRLGLVNGPLPLPRHLFRAVRASTACRKWPRVRSTFRRRHRVGQFACHDLRRGNEPELRLSNPDTGVVMRPWSPSASLIHSEPVPGSAISRSGTPSTKAPRGRSVDSRYRTDRNGKGGTQPPPSHDAGSACAGSHSHSGWDRQSAFCCRSVDCCAQVRRAAWPAVVCAYRFPRRFHLIFSPFGPNRCLTARRWRHPG